MSDTPASLLTVAKAIEVAAGPAEGSRIAAVALREVASVLAGIQSATAEPPDTVEDLHVQAAALQAATEQLARLSAAVGYWSPPMTASAWERLWPTLLSEHASTRTHGMVSELAAYPASLAAYAFGIGAVAAGRYERVATLLSTPIPSDNRPWRPLIEVVSPYLLGDRGAVQLPGATSRIWPFSDHVHSVARPWFADLVPDDADFERQFDRFETLSALARYWLDGPPRADAWVYLGRLRRHGRYLDDATVNLLTEPGRQSPATELLRTLGCPEDEMSTTLEDFHAAARKVLAQVF
ncbi:MAG: hypothetical protein H0W81_02000 [Chloroflexi bacterium]|nr:hypothetical protein [Chloroflexota bacterium]